MINAVRKPTTILIGSSALYFLMGIPEMLRFMATSGSW